MKTKTSVIATLFLLSIVGGFAWAADGDIPDGIGDACEEQLAPVNLDGASSFQLTLRNGAMLLQPFESTTFLTVDFDNADVLSCLWEAGSCDLDAGKVQLCGQTSFAAALGGC